MFNYNPLDCLPSSAELPDSDDTPVDSELQILIPNLLLAILAAIWQTRDDWFFGINMGIYYTPSKAAIVPDGFLSLGVERFVGENGRSSYVLWEEEEIPPILALEVVSQTYNGEYEQKKIDYAELGILYYVIYAPTRLRRKRQRLEVYRLVEGKYILQPGDKIWMSEIGLGIGREMGTYQGRIREWLFWYDQDGKRYQTPEEQLQNLLARLQQQGIDPNTFYSNFH
jgi:Uma2 family endonuclease